MSGTVANASSAEQFDLEPSSQVVVGLQLDEQVAPMPRLRTVSSPMTLARSALVANT